MYISKTKNNCFCNVIKLDLVRQYVFIKDIGSKESILKVFFFLTICTNVKKEMKNVFPGKKKSVPRMKKLKKQQYFWPKYLQSPR